MKIKIKIQDLSERPLNWAVAKCEGATEGYNSLGVFLWDGIPCINAYGHDVDFTPSTNWSYGGPIIEREGISLEYSSQPEKWCACIMADQEVYGPTALIAAMRCYVSSRLGDEVEIPEELLS